MPRMINIADPSNEWAAFLGYVFLGIVMMVTFITFAFNAILGMNTTHLLLMHLILQVNNALPLMRARPPLYLSYFFNKITILNWQISSDKEFYSSFMGKSGKLEAFNYTFELQNIKDSFFFINIFDMLIVSILFLVFRLIMNLVTKKSATTNVQ